MSGPSSGFADPPDDLSGFPSAGPSTELHRLSEHPEPWYFSSVPSPTADVGGRFDLVTPDGTCYLAETLDGALVEKLLRRPMKIVPTERIDELFHTVAVPATPTPPVRVADLTAMAVTGFGENAEIHAGLDYAKPRRWAAALHRAGFRALRYWLRGDPSQSVAGRAHFGNSGLHSRAPRGVRTVRTSPVDAAAAAALLDARNVQVAPIPDQVPVLPAGASLPESVER